jgi:hypothetical protein
MYRKAFNNAIYGPIAETAATWIACVTVERTPPQMIMLVTMFCAWCGASAMVSARRSMRCISLHPPFKGGNVS